MSPTGGVYGNGPDWHCASGVEYQLVLWHSVWYLYLAVSLRTSCSWGEEIAQFVRVLGR